MATSAWSTEAWTDTQQSAGGVTDLTKIRWQADWSAEADGTELRDSNAYGMWNVYNGKVSSEKLLNGRKTIKEVCDWGPASYFGTGFGRTVQTAPFGEEGAEAWFRVWVYHDPGFSWTTSSAARRKNMRQRESRPDGSYGGGSNDIYIVWPNELSGAQPGCATYIRESVTSGPDNGWWNLDPTAAMQYQTGVWEPVEFYVKSSTSSSGGAIKYWKNGVLVGEVTNCKTVLNSDGALHDFLWVSNWNEGLDKVCTYWWCAPAIALRNSARDDTSNMDRDPSGFPFIGVAT